MSHVLDKLTFFTNKAPETFAGGHGVTTYENRDWERAYRGRWWFVWKVPTWKEVEKF